MKLVMSLLVKNGIDQIQQNLDFHFALGIDAAVVIDNGSTDGTLELLQHYQGGEIHILHEEEQNFAQSRWMSRAAFYARDQLGADWVLNNDVDEFWHPLSGDLKQELHDELDMLICPRWDMVFAYDDSSNQSWWHRLIYRVVKTQPKQRPEDFYEQPLATLYPYFDCLPKVMVRTPYLQAIGMGNHHAEFEREPRVAQSQNIQIYHFPIISIEQLQHKMKQGGQAYARNQELPEHMGWHWRRFYYRLQKYGLEAVLAELLPDQCRLQQDLAQGVVIEDRTIEQKLIELGYS